MKQSVRKVINSREACENIQRVACKMDRFSGHCPCAVLDMDGCVMKSPERDENITVPKDYSRKHGMHYGLTEAILNVMTLGLFSRVDALIKHM